jgi:hypothetical protein
MNDFSIAPSQKTLHLGAQTDFEESLAQEPRTTSGLDEAVGISQLSSFAFAGY